MPSYGTNLVTDTLQVNEILTPVETKDINCDSTITTQNLTSTGTINWSNFNPPISAGGNPGLALVLGVSNDAGNEDILDVGRLTFEKDPLEAESSIVGDAVNTTKCYNLDLSDASNTFPGTIEGNLQQTLSLGNDAGTQSIQNLSGLTLTANAPITGSAGNKAVITNCDLSSATNTFPPSLNEGLEATLIQGNDANGQSILNVNALGCSALQSTQVSSQSVIAGALTVNSDANPLSGILNLNVGAQNQNVKLDFTGLSINQNQDTFLEGDNTLVNGVAKMTRCTFLDLSSSTNLLPQNPETDYVWGVIYRPEPQLSFDFDDTPEVVMAENFFFDFSSTNPAHSTCILDTNFYINNFGYGNISLCLFWQKTDGSNTRVVYPGSYLNFIASESATAFRLITGL